MYHRNHRWTRRRLGHPRQGAEGWSGTTSARSPCRTRTSSGAFGRSTPFPKRVSTRYACPRRG